jgi:hypothetical protein
MKTGGDPGCTEKSVIMLYINYEGQVMLETRVSNLCSGSSE